MKKQWLLDLAGQFDLQSNLTLFNLQLFCTALSKDLFFKDVQLHIGRRKISIEIQAAFSNGHHLGITHQFFQEGQ